MLLPVLIAYAAFHTDHLNWKQWLLSIAFGLTSLIVGAILRLIPTNDRIVRVRFARHFCTLIDLLVLFLQTPYNVELSREKLAKRLRKSVSKPKGAAKPAAAAPAASDADKKKNDLEV